jgi:hypothetical protein
VRLNLNPRDLVQLPAEVQAAGNPAHTIVRSGNLPVGNVTAPYVLGMDAGVSLMRWQKEAVGRSVTR